MSSGSHLPVQCQGGGAVRDEDIHILKIKDKTS